MKPVSTKNFIKSNLLFVSVVFQFLSDPECNNLQTEKEHPHVDGNAIFFNSQTIYIGQTYCESIKRFPNHNRHKINREAERM